MSSDVDIHEIQSASSADEYIMENLVLCGPIPQLAKRKITLLLSVWELTTKEVCDEQEYRERLESGQSESARKRHVPVMS